jgi:hypothetical protein
VIKPRITLDVGGYWRCAGANIAHYGKTPRIAYERWQDASDSVLNAEVRQEPTLAFIALKSEPPLPIQPGAEPGGAVVTYSEDIVQKPGWVPAPKSYSPAANPVMRAAAARAFKAQPAIFAAFAKK